MVTDCKEGGNFDVYGVCLEVFAGVSAIVTHEVRNVLAIINESVGLLDDLAMMAGEDGDVPVDRVKVMAARVNNQVARANRLMKDMNTFAHSGDVPCAEIDVSETVDMMVMLTRRKAAARKIEVVSAAASGTSLLRTKPLVLEALIYLCLTAIYEAIPIGSRMNVDVSKENNAAVIKVSLHADDEGGIPAEAWSKPKTMQLAKSIQADCSGDGDALVIRVEPCSQGQ